MPPSAPVVPQSLEPVDLDRYPVHEPGSRGWDAAVRSARERLAAGGCAVLPGFVRASWLDRLRREGESVAPLAHHETEVVNVYNTDPDPDLPADHPARVPLERGNAFVARDRIPHDQLVHRLYPDPGFRAFLAACVGVPELHELGDPFAGLCLNVVADGRSHPWHFDTNEIAISLLTRAPEAGGTFEYCPDIRSADAENTGDVAAVLAGDGGARIRRLDLCAGDLQLFRGRYSLHRVTEVRGATARHTAIFSYSARPGVVGSAVRTRQLFGRTAQVHRSPRDVRVDGLMD
ncbi:HalD/BesD family halogenase [Pseudonocardia sp. HH130630-07]|uniref:HalD/BesD family halogenase n=1 Tax=Pseudonocardia sp. HH130630-07 TaxID=1690815 RepID=UPI0008152547|nr:arpA protein [Pseudonocardia sp. HH130630-07]ANY07108.1 arpA protein [Pseudonocardia sp. HH130630-07]